MQQISDYMEAVRYSCSDQRRRVVSRARINIDTLSEQHIKHGDVAHPRCGVQNCFSGAFKDIHIESLVKKYCDTSVLLHGYGCL
jgi:hypothetical protein